MEDGIDDDADKAQQRQSVHDQNDQNQEDHIDNAECGGCECSCTDDIDNDDSGITPTPRFLRLPPSPCNDHRLHPDYHTGRVQPQYYDDEDFQWDGPCCGKDPPQPDPTEMRVRTTSSTSTSSTLSSNLILWKSLYLASIILYIVCNGVLLYVNLTRTQTDIEAHCYLSFHLVSFWSTFLFTLVEAVVLYHTTIRTPTNTSNATNNTTTRSPRAVPWTLGMLWWNIISTFGIALLFTIDPHTYEHIAHLLEYIIQMGISIGDLAIVVVVVIAVTAPTTTNRNKSPIPLPQLTSNYYDHNNEPSPRSSIDTYVLETVTHEQNDTNGHRKRKATTSDYRNHPSNTTATTKPYSIILVIFEFLIAIIILILSILTFLLYTATDVTTPTDPWMVTTTATTTWQQALVLDMGGPEHAAHTMEFITEILNGIFVFIFTYASMICDNSRTF
jgi:hypothetical protein